MNVKKLTVKDLKKELRDVADSQLPKDLSIDTKSAIQGLTASALEMSGGYMSSDYLSEKMRKAIRSISEAFDSETKKKAFRKQLKDELV